MAPSARETPDQPRCTVCGAAYASGERFCPLDGGPVVAAAGADDPLIGRTIGGRYFIRRQLARGGMGAVYEAEHVGLDKRVAVKFILDRFGDDREALHRFHREARTASRIGHENIIDITDIGETEDERPFLVMEYLEGSDLDQVLRATGRMEPSRAVHIVAQVLRGLAAAHGHGIIHRDMKPANVFLTERSGVADFVKIMDFGISKVMAARDARVRLTETGVAMGTPIYMAPEQAEARPDLDHRIDLYAVGVMLYEMLSGEPPFNASSYLILVQQHVSSPVPPLAERRPDLPASLVRAVHKALEKKPERRFADALEFAAALPPVQSLRASWEAGATLKEGATPRKRRSRVLPLALASVVIGAAAVTGGVVLYQKKDTGPGEQAAGSREPAPEPAIAKAATPAPAPVATAVLEIDSAPRGAQVFVGGAHRGQTPLRLEGLAAGTYLLRIEARGFEELEAEKAVRPGYAESFFAVLARRGSGRQATVTKSGRDGAGKRQPEPRREPAPGPAPRTDTDGSGKPNPYLDP
ncbi:MAG TPA: serine/threonine-protein kinase [Kofleriaceae bacterium]|nr:serine/threonine-protein kinase [Kofleriaceae bacterium]